MSDFDTKPAPTITMTFFGPDENRAVEAIAAMLDLFPRIYGEDDESLARRMAGWGAQQGPEVRLDALLFASRAMIAALPQGLHFTELAQVGLEALHKFNEMRSLI